VAQGVEGFRFPSIDGGEIGFADWDGPVLVANTASLCGFTPQLAELQALWESHGPRGLTVLACRRTAFARSSVRQGGERVLHDPVRDHDAHGDDHARDGRGGHPFFGWLRETAGFEPRWNFNKVLWARTGRCWGPGARARARRGPRSPRRSRRRWRRPDAGLHRDRRSIGGRATALAPAAHSAGEHGDGPRAQPGLAAGGAIPREPPGEAGGAAAWHTGTMSRRSSGRRRRRAVSEGCGAGTRLGTVSNPVFPEMFRRPATGWAASMLAAELLRDGGRGACAGRGHAPRLSRPGERVLLPQRSVFAVLALRAQGARRVAYVDIDAHHCDGVEWAFRGEPEVLVLSTHEDGRWPRTGALESGGWGTLEPAGAAGLSTTTTWRGCATR
jgi:glutathione peroxidase-family protein